MNPCQICPRRKFLGGLAAVGGLWSGLLPASGQAPVNPLTDRLYLKVAGFPGLAAEGDSVFLTHDSGGTLLLINRAAGNTYHVLNPTCRHQGCRVDPYDAVSQLISCPCHGAAYGIDGKLVNGPAQSDLLRYTGTYRDGVLEVEIPGLSFGITTQSRLRNAAGAERIAISFMAKQASYYAVRRASSPAGPFSPVPFALQADGPLAQTQLIGDGSGKTVFVDAGGQRGFYVLELLIFEIS